MKSGKTLLVFSTCPELALQKAVFVAQFTSFMALGDRCAPVLRVREAIQQ
jgi:hypothetical protein